MRYLIIIMHLSLILLPSQAEGELYNEPAPDTFDKLHSDEFSRTFGATREYRFTPRPQTNSSRITAQNVIIWSTSGQIESQSANRTLPELIQAAYYARQYLYKNFGDVLYQEGYGFVEEKVNNPAAINRPAYKEKLGKIAAAYQALLNKIVNHRDAVDFANKVSHESDLASQSPTWLLLYRDIFKNADHRKELAGRTSSVRVEEQGILAAALENAAVAIKKNPTLAQVGKLASLSPADLDATLAKLSDDDAKKLLQFADGAVDEPLPGSRAEGNYGNFHSNNKVVKRVRQRVGMPESIFAALPHMTDTELENLYSLSARDISSLRDRDAKVAASDRDDKVKRIPVREIKSERALKEVKAALDQARATHEEKFVQDEIKRTGKPRAAVERDALTSAKRAAPYLYGDDSAFEPIVEVEKDGTSRITLRISGARNIKQTRQALLDQAHRTLSPDVGQNATYRDDSTALRLPKTEEERVRFLAQHRDNLGENISSRSVGGLTNSYDEFLVGSLASKGAFALKEGGNVALREVSREVGKEILGGVIVAPALESLGKRGEGAAGLATGLKILLQRKAPIEIFKALAESDLKLEDAPEVERTTVDPVLASARTRPPTTALVEIGPLPKRGPLPVTDAKPAQAVTPIPPVKDRAVLAAAINRHSPDRVISIDPTPTGDSRERTASPVADAKLAAVTVATITPPRTPLGQLLASSAKDDGKPSAAPVIQALQDYGNAAAAKKLSRAESTKYLEPIAKEILTQLKLTGSTAENQKRLSELQSEVRAARGAKPEGLQSDYLRFLDLAIEAARNEKPGSDMFKLQVWKQLYPGYCVGTTIRIVDDPTCSGKTNAVVKTAPEISIPNSNGLSAAVATQPSVSYAQPGFTPSYQWTPPAVTYSAPTTPYYYRGGGYSYVPPVQYRASPYRLR